AGGSGHWMCWCGPLLRNSSILRAGVVHSSEIAGSHAWEQSIARESGNLTRGSSPSLRNRGFLRVGAVHRSGIGKSHAQEQSTAQEPQNSMRREESVEHEQRLKVSRVIHYIRKKL